MVRLVQVVTGAHIQTQRAWSRRFGIHLALRIIHDTPSAIEMNQNRVYFTFPSISISNNSRKHSM